MINAANISASVINSPDKSGGGFVKASVVGGPDGAGAFTLRLEGGREVSVTVEEGDAKTGMAPGQKVLVNLSEGKILIPNAPQGQQSPLSPQTLSAELPQQSSQQPAQTLPAELPQQSMQTAQTPTAGLPQQSPQPAQTPPVQPFARINADVFIAGELAKQIRDGLESPLLRALPAELIEKIATERGGIDVAALNALDAVLRKRSLPLDASSPLTLERLEQWLRIALDNPKLAEDLADRVPLTGAREIIEKFLQLNRLGVNFLPDNLLQNLSAERLFGVNDGGAGQNTGINAGNAINNAFGNNVNVNNGAGTNAGNVLNNVSENSVSSSGASLKGLFDKTFSAAPAALLELVKRIDTSDINANNVKLPPEEARRIVNELINRLPSQAAGKPELVHDMKQLPPHIAESANAHGTQNKTESTNACIISNKQDSTAYIISNKQDLNAHIISNKADSSATTVIPNKSDSPNVNIISNKQDSSAHIIPNKTDSTVATVIPNKSDLPNVHVISNKQDSNAHIIPNKADSAGTTVIPNKSDTPNVNIIPNRTDSPAQVSQTSVNSFLEPSHEARHPVPQNIYGRIESSSHFNIPTENKNALFSQIGAAQEAIRSVLDSGARAADVNAAAVRQAVSNNIPTDNKHTVQLTQAATIPEINRHTSQLTQQATTPNISSSMPQTTPSEAVVKQAVSDDALTDGKHAARLTQQATISEINRHTSQFTQQASTPATLSPQLKQQASNPLAAPSPLTSTLPQSTPAQPTPVTFSQSAPTQPTLATLPQTTPSQPTPSTLSPSTPSQPTPATLPQSTPSQIAPSTLSQSAPSPSTSSTPPLSTPSTLPQSTLIQTTPPQIAAEGEPAVRQAPPDILAQAARRLLDNTEKLRVGFQEAFSSLDLQSRVFPSDFSGGAGASAVRQSLDALRLETLLNASKALQDIFSIVEELRGAVELLSDKSREPTDAEKLLTRTAENLARQARQCGNEIADRLNDALRELNRMQTDSSRGDGELAARQSPAEVMRSAALTVAGGLESLHLLASAARGQELQQQVVALPVKIGDEWTEVQVKIIKEREGKGKKGKKEGGGHVSVYLNAAPSMLGEVTAHLDYYPPASLKLSFQFVKPEATKWFRERATALRDAIAAAGLPGAALEFHTRQRPARAQSADNQEVTPVGAVAASGAGRVDFRA